jgi:hypothetical protein
LAKLDLKTFARRGAEARLAELNLEIKAIHSAFPDLRPGRTRQGLAAAPASAASPRRRKTMSAAQRKAVSERMRKYWAARRAQSMTTKATKTKKR